jgi:hypothetical protein
VLLLAWPAGEPPDLTGSLNKLTALSTVAAHQGTTTRSGKGELVLSLPADADGLWSAAAVLVDDGGEPAVDDFLLEERP